jgi:predicted transcriptional regulator
MPKTDVGAALMQEVAAVKRLLIFKLLRDGASQADVATALGVNQSQVSRMFPSAARKKKRRKND